MTGSLQVKKNMYYAVLNFKDKTGKRKQKWISTGLEVRGNKRRAEQALNELKAQYSTLEYIEPTRVYLCDFIKEWVELNKINIQVTTYDGYIHMLGRHIYPYFKERCILLSKVKPIDIQRYHYEKLEEGLSPNTVIKHHAIIRSALQYGVKNSLVQTNVADLVDKPKRQRYHASFYNKDELSQLLTVAKRHPLEVPIVIASYYGLRRSEILGLKWSSIDFENKLLTVCHKVVRGKDASGNLICISQDKLKSETSHRQLPLSDALLAYFKELKATTECNKKLMGNSYTTAYEDFVCVNALGNLIQPDYITGTFPKLLESHGLRKIRFHDLRHSCATLLLSLGYSLKDIQTWLGHSDFLITANTYTHSDFTNRIEMINSVDKLLG